MCTCVWWCMRNECVSPVSVQEHDDRKFLSSKAYLMVNNPYFRKKKTKTKKKKFTVQVSVCERKCGNQQQVKKKSQES